MAAPRPYVNDYKTYTGAAPTDPTQARGMSEYTYLSSTNPEEFGNLYNKYGKQYGWLSLAERQNLYNQNVLAPQLAAQTPTPAAPAPANPVAGATPPNGNVAEIPNSGTLFPTTTTPTTNPTAPPQFNFDYNQAKNWIADNTKLGDVMSYVPKLENDEIYRYQMDEGSRALAARNAARGLSGSGAEQEGERRLTGQLLADRGQRAIDVAKTDQSARISQNTQGLNALSQFMNAATARYGTDQQAYSDFMGNLQREADRLYNMNQNEALRGLTLNQQEIDKWGTGLDFLSNLNITGLGEDASKVLSNLLAQYGGDIVNMVSQMRK